MSVKGKQQTWRRCYISENGFRQTLQMRGSPTHTATSGMSDRRSPRPADDSHLPAASAAAEELIAAVGFEPRNAYAGRHVECLQDFTLLRIDSPQIALLTFPGGMPELSIDPSDPCDETIGLDGAKNIPGLGIDLMDLPVPILPCLLYTSRCV